MTGKSASFRKRFASKNEAGRLDWNPIITVKTNPEVRIYDTTEQWMGEAGLFRGALGGIVNPHVISGKFNGRVPIQLRQGTIAEEPSLKDRLFPILQQKIRLVSERLEAMDRIIEPIRHQPVISKDAAIRVVVDAARILMTDEHGIRRERSLDVIGDRQIFLLQRFRLEHVIVEHEINMRTEDDDPSS
jgi:hypothetical protein